MMDVYVFFTHRSYSLRSTFRCSRFGTDFSLRASIQQELLMTGTQVRFDVGAGYERYMGNWSQRRQSGQAPA
jgi:hypothetical protein